MTAMKCIKKLMCTIKLTFKRARKMMSKSNESINTLLKRMKSSSRNRITALLHLHKTKTKNSNSTLRRRMRNKIKVTIYSFGWMSYRATMRPTPWGLAVSTNMKVLKAGKERAMWWVPKRVMISMIQKRKRDHLKRPVLLINKRSEQNRFMFEASQRILTQLLHLLSCYLRWGRFMTPMQLQNSRHPNQCTLLNNKNQQSEQEELLWKSNQRKGECDSNLKMLMKRGHKG